MIIQPDLCNGVEIDDSLETLRPMFTTWLQIFDDSFNLFRQTTKVWFQEVSITAQLAAAAWKVGVPAICELKCLRPSAYSHGNGNVDLALSLQGNLFLIESKLTYFDSNDSFDEVIGKLEDAENDARSIDPLLTGQRLALCYGRMKRGGNLAERIAFARKSRKSLDVFVWYADDGAPADVEYPGFIIVGRRVPR